MAALYRRAECLKFLINKRSIDINEQNCGGQTPLHSAVFAEGSDEKELNLDCIRLLLNAGAVIKRDKVGFTPAHYLIRYCDSPEGLKIFLENGVDIKGSGSYGWTFLHLALLHKREKTRGFLFARKELIDLDAQDDLKNTPLHIAAEVGDTKAVEFLLECGVKILTNMGWDDPCDMARFHGHFGCVSVFEKYKKSDANVKQIPEKRKNKRRSKNEAVSNTLAGKDEAFERVSSLVSLIAGNDEDDVAHKLFNAAAKYDSELLSQIMATDKSSVHAKNNLGLGLVHVAIKFSEADGVTIDRKTIERKIKCIRMLLYNGAEIFQDSYGNTPGHYMVAICDSTEMLDCLLIYGLKVNDENNHGSTILQLAVLYKRHETIKRLLRSKETLKLDIDVQEEEGYTALHIAARLGSVNLTSMLLSAGAKILQDSENKYPQDLAKEAGHASCVKLIERHIAKSNRICSDIQPKVDGVDEHVNVTGANVVKRKGKKKRKNKNRKRQETKINSTLSPHSKEEKPKDDKIVRRSDVTQLMFKPIGEELFVEDDKNGFITVEKRRTSKARALSSRPHSGKRRSNKGMSNSCYNDAQQQVKTQKSDTSYLGMVFLLSKNRRKNFTINAREVVQSVDNLRAQREDNVADKAFTDQAFLALKENEHKIKRDDIPLKVWDVINKLRPNSQKVWIVGGFIRDMLLNRKEVNDYDLVTTIPLGQALAILHDIADLSYRVEGIPPCQCIRATFAGFDVDITTLSPEGSEEHINVQLKNNINSRDFTINSCLLDTDSFEMLCTKQAREDIENKIIRTIGKPNILFGAKPSQILRALRYKIVLDLRIEKEAYEYILQNISQVSNSSVSSRFSELCKIFKGIAQERMFRAISMLTQLGCLGELAAGVNGFYSARNGYCEPPNIDVLTNAAKEGDFNTLEKLIKSGGYNHVNITTIENHTLLDLAVMSVSPDDTKKSEDYAKCIACMILYGGTSNVVQTSLLSESQMPTANGYHACSI